MAVIRRAVAPPQQQQTLALARRTSHDLDPDLGVERLLDAEAALYLGLAALDLRHDALDVGQLVAALPEHLRVLHHLLGRLALHLVSDALKVVAAVLLVRFDELVEVALRPRVEALAKRTHQIHH